jgi:hypothetical protein
MEANEQRGIFVDQGPNICLDLMPSRIGRFGHVGPVVRRWRYLAAGLILAVERADNGPPLSAVWEPSKPNAIFRIFFPVKGSRPPLPAS